MIIFGFLLCLLSFIGGVLCIVQFEEFKPETKLEVVLRVVLLTLGVSAVSCVPLFLIELIELL